MPATKTSKTTESRAEQLLRQHRELTALYPGQSGAAKAQTSRKINLVQVELDLLGIEDYDFWTKPTAEVTRSWTHTPEELLERIAGLRRNMKRTDRDETYLAAVDRELTAALLQCEKRQIPVPDES
jgi:hypothetical protein